MRSRSARTACQGLRQYRGAQSDGVRRRLLRRQRTHVATHRSDAGRYRQIIGRMARRSGRDVEPGRFARQSAQIVEAGAAYAVSREHLQLVDSRRMHRKDSLDADAVRNLANGEGRAVGAAIYFDHDAFEGLDALLLAFDDLDVNANRVADAEFRQVLAQAPLFELLDNGVHGKKDLESSQISYPNAGRRSMGTSITRSGWLRGKTSTTGPHLDDPSPYCSTGSWPDVWQRIKRGGVRASDAQPAATRSTRTDARVVSCIVRPCDAVLDARLRAAEFSIVAALRALERVRIPVGCGRFRDPALRGRVFARRSGANQQQDRQMDTGIAS